MGFFNLITWSSWISSLVLVCIRLIRTFLGDWRDLFGFILTLGTCILWWRISLCFGLDWRIPYFYAIFTINSFFMVLLLSLVVPFMMVFSAWCWWFLRGCTPDSGIPTFFGMSSLHPWHYYMDTCSWGNVIHEYFLSKELCRMAFSLMGMQCKQQDPDIACLWSSYLHDLVIIHGVITILHSNFMMVVSAWCWWFLEGCTLDSGTLAFLGMSIFHPWHYYMDSWIWGNGIQAYFCLRSCVEGNCH